MMDTLKQTLTKGFLAGKQRTYSELVEFLDKKWAVTNDAQTLERMKALDKALGNIAQKMPTIFVTGTNGKSLTAYFTAQLLKTEGLKVGTYYAPHVLTYNERFALNNEAISNKVFSEMANFVINAAEANNIKATTQELLAMMSLMFFTEQKADVAVCEIGQRTTHDPMNVCTARVITITRLTEPVATMDEAQMQAFIKDALGAVKKGTQVISGDQNKSHLALMQQMTESVAGVWAMPIRKLATLPYPFEQIHGRCAALAERTAQIFMETTMSSDTVVTDSLLIKPKGQRGRPTIEEKRRTELNPKRTLEQFWKETANELPCRFQLLDKEKPSILLDNARNIDAFKNLLLGIRLLHYQRPFKGLAIIVGAAQDTLHSEEFLKMLRYFFKKTSGQLFLCPLEEPVAGTGEYKSWDVEQVTNDIKAMKVKARACKSFDEAFDAAKKSIDERNGLVVITGSQSIIHQFWKHKGIKKF